CLHISTAFASHFAAPHHIDPARSVGFSTKQRRTPAVAAARMDWVMSPSSGDALLCFVKRTVPAGSNGTSWYRQDYTQHKVVVPRLQPVPKHGVKRIQLQP
ncbi:hypothetical protein, partial [Salmonella enterica]|uniref:hypothetical protein n=1 Tax=Salmonella enterica TaxID=28901 RepID=UPI001D0C7CA0